jgi:hypothetical protein
MDESSMRNPDGMDDVNSEHIQLGIYGSVFLFFFLCFRMTPPSFVIMLFLFWIFEYELLRT